MSSDEDVAICMWYTLKNLEANNNKKKKLWIHLLNKKRITHNVILSLICELCSDESKFKNYTRISTITFDFILKEIEGEIRKEDTHFRKSISPEERLLVTLR